MRIYIVRHGESEANINKSVYRTIQNHLIALTLEGENQAEKVGKELAEKVEDQKFGVFVSPFERTKATWNGMSKELPKARFVQIDARLREQDWHNFGETDDFSQELFTKMRDDFYYRFKGGESGADAYARAKCFLRDATRIGQETGVNSLIIVTHGIFSNLMLMAALSMEIKWFKMLPIMKNCEVRHLDYQNSTFRATVLDKRGVPSGFVNFM